MEFIQNGQASGSIGQRLLASNMDPNVLRPYIAEDGRHYITQVRNGAAVAVPVGNAVATLRRDEWKIIDDAVILSARQRLRVVASLREQGLVYNIPNAMGKTVLETAVMSDITGATISMDPIRKSDSDRPEFDIGLLPLPIIHKDFSFTAREIAVSRNSNTPLDTTMAEMAARKVAEEAEELALGTTGTFSYGGGTIYGLTNYPGRHTATLTDPTSSGWTPSVFITEVLAMKQASMDDRMFGPWALYLSPSWDQYLDGDYHPEGGDRTLRERLQAIQGIVRIETVDFLTGLQAILVQQTTETIRLVLGMDITTLQWETQGGMQQNFKVMAMMVPQIRGDINGRTGLIHGSVP